MKELTQISSETCLQHLWRVTSAPPDYIQEVSVETSASMHERAMALVLRENCMAVEELEQQLDVELVQFINKETTKQANSKLWIDLHKGRLTSSVFGNVYRAKNSPSLVNRIVENRYV